MASDHGTPQRLLVERSGVGVLTPTLNSDTCSRRDPDANRRARRLTDDQKCGGHAKQRAPLGRDVRDVILPVNEEVVDQTEDEGAAHRRRHDQRQRDGLL